MLIDLEKVPFDLVEAESELIDGVTTELAGFGFSLTYAAEVAGGFLTLKFVTSVVGVFSFFCLACLVLLSFVGRVFVARFLMADFMQLCLSIGLPLTALLVTVLEFPCTQVQTHKNSPPLSIFAFPLAAYVPKVSAILDWLFVRGRRILDNGF